MHEHEPITADGVRLAPGAVVNLGEGRRYQRFRRAVVSEVDGPFVWLVMQRYNGEALRVHCPAGWLTFVPVYGGAR